MANSLEKLVHNVFYIAQTIKLDYANQQYLLQYCVKMKKNNEIKNLNKEAKPIQIQKQQSEANSINIRSLQVKFMPYVNDLNSSIGAAKRRTYKNQRCYQTNESSFTFKSSSCESFGGFQMTSSKGTRKSSKDSKKIKDHDFKIISGTIINGYSKGEALLQFKNGLIFKGMIEDSKLKFGTITLQNGTRYIGAFKNFLLHGFGSLILPNGTEFRSIFNQGIISNQSQILYENGDVYKGQISKYKKHGSGQLTFSNGDRYVGQFCQGNISGRGEYYQNNRLVAFGMWRNGQLQQQQQNDKTIDRVIQNYQRA